MVKARIRILSDDRIYMYLYTDNKHIYANIVDKLKILESLENKVILQPAFCYIYRYLVIYNFY